MSLGNVLVIRPGALGDAILTLPALTALSAAGAASVSVLGTPASWAFLARNANVPRVLDFAASEWLGLFADGANLSPRAREILEDTEAAIVYLSDTLEFERRLRAFGVKNVWAIDPPVMQSHAMKNEAVDTRVRRTELTAQHVARRLLDPLRALVSEDVACKALKIDSLERTGWLAPSPEELCEARALLATMPGAPTECFVLHPGSGSSLKCWAAEKFAELAARIARKWNLFPIVLFGPADAHLRAEFDAAMPPGVAYRTVLQRPLREVLALLHLSRFFVGNDSGVSHLAARATGVLAIFGPTDPAEWAPVGADVQMMRARGGIVDNLTVDYVFESVAECFFPGREFGSKK